MPIKSRSKRIRDLFYFPTDDSDDWERKFGTTRKQSGSGYTNLLTIVLPQHSSDYDALIGNSSYHSSFSNSQNLFCNSKTVQVHGQLDLVVNGLRPLYVTENPVFRKIIRFPPLRYGTLMKHMHVLTLHVESNITRRLPENSQSYSADGLKIKLTSFEYLQHYQITHKLVTQICYLVSHLFNLRAP